MSENLLFFDVFNGCSNQTLGKNGPIKEMTFFVDIRLGEKIEFSKL